MKIQSDNAVHRTINLRKRMPERGKMKIDRKIVRDTGGECSDLVPFCRKHNHTYNVP